MVQSEYDRLNSELAAALTTAEGLPTGSLERADAMRKADAVCAAINDLFESDEP